MSRKGMPICHDWRGILATVFLVCTILGTAFSARGATADRFEISFPASARAKAVTGRVLVIVTRRNKPDPRIQLLSLGVTPPFFGKDVNHLEPGETVTIDEKTTGYPLRSLKGLPAADYYIEAMLNVYTRVDRADGHTIWAHFDWVGGFPMIAPGNLHSTVRKVHLDPTKGFNIHLSLDRVISLNEFAHGGLVAQLAPPHETKWIKVVKFESHLLTQFWGHPMYLGAAVLLPKGYYSHPHSYYPVVYNQGHFNQWIPWSFNPNPKSETPEAVAEGKAGGWGTGYDFYRAWISHHFPRFIMVTFQHPCPYFDDSYAVNSANCGPFGDAIMKELIPYVESHFRIIRRPFARLLEGGSTGGWESLALQVFHPRFFGGAWVFDPDPIDFRRFQLVNIYKDKSAFTYRPHRSPWLSAPRPWSRTSQGQVTVTLKQMSHQEAVLGSHGRSDLQLDGWWAIWVPVGRDGYPVPLWNMQTGAINHHVANYMRKHGYDLSYYIRTHWHQIGPDLVGKLHFFVGDMDNYYLNLAVYKMENFLRTTSDPYYGGTFVYGRPMKGHGWHPMTWAELMREMAQQVRDDAPKGSNTAAWNYE